MFILALIYLIVFIGLIVFNVNEKWNRFGGFAQMILFGIIGVVLFWSVLNK